MSIENTIINNKNTSIFYGNPNREIAKMEENEKARGNKSGKHSIFAGELNIPQDNIAMKKIQAQRHAIKTVMDTFSKEHTIDENLETRRRHSDELKDELVTANNELEKITTAKEKLKDVYGIDENSQEEKDLKLLKKQQTLQAMGREDLLTEEEKNQLQNMDPITDYQKAALTYGKLEDGWKKEIQDTSIEEMVESRTIESMKLSRLKCAPMIDANEIAEKTMESANKEMEGMLLNEGKEHIDDEIEKNQEKAEKAKEEEEKKKKLEEKNSNESTNSISNDDSKNMEQLQKAETDQKQFKQELQYMINTQKLLEEDLKGLNVDTQL